jgi:hypothetical protein
MVRNGRHGRGGQRSSGSTNRFAVLIIRTRWTLFAALALAMSVPVLAASIGYDFTMMAKTGDMISGKTLTGFRLPSFGANSPAIKALGVLYAKQVIRATERAMERAAVGVTRVAGPNSEADAYSFPRCPLATRLKGLSRFVVTRGGEYRFLPASAHCDGSGNFHLRAERKLMNHGPEIGIPSAYQGSPL